MRKAIRGFITIVLLFTVFNPIFGQEPGETKVSGYVMADYYWVTENHNKELKDKHGFWFRRIYLGFDHKFDDQFSSRLRFEMNSPGDFETREKMNLIVKDAFMQYKVGGQALLVGMSGTPTWGIVEKIWGYRAVEKTLLDLQKFGSSRDLGFAAKGKFDRDGIVKYHVMFGNGASNNSEINKGKKFFGSVSYWPMKEVVFEVYGDYNDNEGENDEYTFQGFASFKNKLMNFAVQYFHRINYVPGEPDAKFDGLSAWVTMNFAEKWSAYARMDRMFQANPNGESIDYLPFDATAKSTLLIFGLDFHPVKNIKIMPNVEVVLYDKNDAGVKPGSDVIPRLSFFFAI